MRLRAAMAIVLVIVTGACAAAPQEIIVRGVDDVVVMSPEEVAAVRDTVLLNDAPLVDPALVNDDSTVPSGDSAASGVAADVSSGEPTTTTTDPAAAPAESGETIPLNTDNRPPELRLFEAFGEFRSCLEDRGFGIQGDLQDPSNPAFKDPAYVEALQTCAARSDIVSVLAEVESTRADLSPDEVETRNESFVLLKDCLERRGWTVETSTSSIGLLEPTTFLGPDGTLDERDINQCLEETGISDALEEQTG